MGCLRSVLRPWDHPRACGVYLLRSCPEGPSPGSSPRVRGLPRTLTPTPTRRGIIPARAGFTKINPKPLDNHQDHPRACGVYFEGVVEHGGSGGSSPHTRGLPLPPAPTPQALGDHPRTRGVYASSSPRAARTAGSSPHTRGLRHQVVCRVPHQRIIPAHAGFTGHRDQRHGDLTDHPRTRGVYRLPYQVAHELCGSSPHTRGLPERAL